MHRTKHSLVALALVAFLLAACASDNKTTAVSGSSSGPAQSSGTASSSSSSGTTTTAPEVKAESVAVTAGESSEFAYTTTLSSVKAGPVEVALTNKGKQEHQATLIKLHAGVDLGAIAAASASDPTGASVFKLFDPAGGPNAVEPGATVTSTQVLSAGSYLMLCFIPDPADNTPHAAKGMVQPFTVTENPDIEDLSSVKLADDETGRAGLTEFAFDVPDTVEGKATVQVENTGTQAHEMAIYKLADGKTIDDMKTFFSGPPTGPPPFTSAGGVSALAPGTEITVDVDLKPGSYALICFLPDSSGSGKAHFELGMLKQVKVE
jgi:uncharacterized cupredoxin-like copper-binding protein